jgi:hypothetical protein
MPPKAAAPKAKGASSDHASYQGQQLPLSSTTSHYDRAYIILVAQFLGTSCWLPHFYGVFG